MKRLLLALLLPTSVLAHEITNGKFESYLIDTKYGSLYFEKEGVGPVVVLVAGGPGGSHASFHPTFSTLSNKFTVIYLDNIGRGRSARLLKGKQYTVERDVEDIEAVRKFLGVDTISVIGHSYGAMPALSYAEAYPNHTSKLVLASSPIDGHYWQSAIDEDKQFLKSQYPDVLQKIIELRSSTDIDAAKKIVDLNNFLPDRSWANLENKTKRWRSNDPVDKSNQDVYTSIAGEDADAELSGTILTYQPLSKIEKIKSPILICTGRHDYVTPPRIAFELQSKLPKNLTSIQIFEKSGHRPWAEESELYLIKISEFLSK